VWLITNPRLREMAENLLAEAEERHDRKGEKVRFFSEGPRGAASWEHPRRVLYKAEAMDKGTNTRFIVTTRTDEPKELHEFCARSGQSENWIKDFNVHIKADRLSWHRFIANQFRHLLHAAAILADGRLEEEARGERSAADAIRHNWTPCAKAHQDWRKGQRAPHKDPRVSCLGPSRTRLMARPFGSPMTLVSNPD
jgi:hypothetical protein